MMSELTDVEKIMVSCLNGAFARLAFVCRSHDWDTQRVTVELVSTARLWFMFKQATDVSYIAATNGMRLLHGSITRDPSTGLQTDFEELLALTREFDIVLKFGYNAGRWTAAISLIDKTPGGVRQLLDIPFLSYM